MLAAPGKQINSKMPDTPEKKPAPNKNASYLPHFCDADVFLRAVLVIELVAIVFALVGYETGSLYTQVAMHSVFLQWVGLTSAALLCAFTRQGWIRTIFIATVIAFGVILFITLLASLISAYLIETIQINTSTNSLAYVLLRNITIAAILTGLSLRYFYLQYESKQILMVQAQARLQALQARIRPHFLFNSMNTIASLTHDQPALAEQSIENLADLFRASLAAESSISLHQELELTRSYIALETLRLGDRLRVNWCLPEQTVDVDLPALTLQPLVENAIYHGIEPLAQGGVVDITIQAVGDSIEIIISNPVFTGGGDQHREGNQMAVDNIRERLQIAFGGVAEMRQLKQNDRFTVTLKIPLKSV